MAEPGAGDAAGAPPPRVGAWVPVLVEQMVNDTLVVTLSCGERRFTGVLLDCSKRCGRGRGHRDRGGSGAGSGGAALPPRPLFGRAGQSGGAGSGAGHAAGAERSSRPGAGGAGPAAAPHVAPGSASRSRGRWGRPLAAQPPRRSLPSPCSLSARSALSSPCRTPGRAPAPGGGSGQAPRCAGVPGAAAAAARPCPCPSREGHLCEPGISANRAPQAAALPAGTSCSHLPRSEGGCAGGGEAPAGRGLCPLPGCALCWAVP